MTSSSTSVTSVEDLTVDNVPVGTPIGRAWLRLFGVVPFDYDRLTIAALEPGRSFDEQSTMMSMRRWRHQRSVTPESARSTSAAQARPSAMAHTTRLAPRVASPQA